MLFSTLYFILDLRFNENLIGVTVCRRGGAHAVGGCVMRLLVVEDDEKLAKILSTSLSVIGDFFVTFEIEYGTSKFEVEIGAINIPAAQTPEA